MKTSLTLLLAILISIATYAQSSTSQPDLSGVWYMTKDQKAVILYPNGSAYDILPFDMDLVQIGGRAIAQCIFHKKSYFRVIGLIADRKGDQRPIKCLIDFNGSDQIRAIGDARFHMTLIKRLSSQEMAAIAQSSNPAPSPSANIGFSQTQQPRDPMRAPANLPQLMPNQASVQQNDPMASLNNNNQMFPHPIKQTPLNHVSSAQQLQYSPQQNTAIQRQPIPYNQQPNTATQQQPIQYRQAQYSNREQHAPSGQGQNNSQYQQPIRTQPSNYTVQTNPNGHGSPSGQNNYQQQNNHMKQPSPYAPGKNIVQYQQPVLHNQQANYPVQTYPQGQYQPQMQSGYMSTQANNLEQPQKPKRKRQIGKKIFKGLSTALEIAGDLGVVPGLGVASNLVNKIGEKNQ